MASPSVFTDLNDAVLQDRLARVSENLRSLNLSTAEDYQAEVYSQVNAVLSLDGMTPLAPVGSEGPAIVGDAAINYTILNNDAEDIAKEMLRIEDAASSLFNISATYQNQLRQQIREFTFASTKQRYTEGFLNANNLTNVTAGLDFSAGLATNGLLDETQLQPVISLGQSSQGSMDAGSSVTNLSDRAVDSSLMWTGSVLELVFTFATAAIVNRLEISLGEYAGLEIDTLLTSPDGTLTEDILADLGVDHIVIDGTSGKFSGDVVIDFPPRHTKTLRLVISDRVGSGKISLRAATLWARRYQSTGQLTSTAINLSSDSVIFTPQQNVFSPYVSITHQISYDNVSFAAINPGDTISLVSSPFYYRATLERSPTRFQNSSQILAQTPLDQVPSGNYQLASTTTVPVGNNIIERTIVINNVVGPITLKETPIPNTLQVQEGSVILNSGAGDYSFSNNTISFPASVTGITLSYQTTSLGQAAIADREEYYTALLYEAEFEAA